MKLAVNNTIDGLDGKPMTYEEEKEIAGSKAKMTITLTFKKVTTDALCTLYQDEKDLSGEEKIKRALLAQKIYSAQDIVEITVDEAGLIKKLVNRLYGTIPYFRVHEMIENAAKAPGDANA